MHWPPLITKLDRCLATKRPAYYALLQPGATEADLEAFESRFSLELPFNFKQLYKWRNGQDPMSFEPLDGNRSFMTMNDVIRTKDLLDGMVGFDFDDPRYWRRGWVPFLHNGAGSYLCLDLLAEDGGNAGQILAFWKADKDRPIQFPSIDAWVENLVSSMEKRPSE